MTSQCSTVTATPWFSTGRSLFTPEAQRSRNITWTRDAVGRACGGRSTSHQLEKDSTRFTDTFSTNDQVSVNEALMLIICWQVEGLTEGAVYQFQVYAANLAGLGPASKHSADFTCEAWNMPEPGECDHLPADSLRHFKQKTCCHS